LAEGEEPWQPSKLYWVTWPRERTRQRRRLAAEAGEIPAEEAEVEPDTGTMEEHISTYLDVAPGSIASGGDPGPPHPDRRDRMAPHHPEDVRRRAFSREAFIRAFSWVEAPAEAPDLFAGLR